MHYTPWQGEYRGSVQPSQGYRRQYCETHILPSRQYLNFEPHYDQGVVPMESNKAITGYWHDYATGGQ